MPRVVYMGTSLVLHNINNTSRITCTRSFNACDNTHIVFLVINIFVNCKNAMVKRLCSSRQTSPLEKIKLHTLIFEKKKKSFRYIKSNRKVWRG